MSRSNWSSASPSPRFARTVTAVLGPTNTGKTHLAIERLLAHDSGLIALPLRLLAREVYDKVAGRVGGDQVALITGEEKIKPPRARYFISTLEAMPLDEAVDFLAIDEIQLAADGERGHVFTDRLLHGRGQSETLLLGAATMRSVIGDLIPGINMVSRPRLSKLSYTGHKKLSRLPRRSAIVAFSASDVYAIAELIRGQRGGAAVVMGALSPRTRNAQVELYQSGEVDYLVATDAIGMGLNLDVNHIAFAASRKFDGRHHRDITPAELAQIAGRAGRHMNDGTFGVTASVSPFEPGIVTALENHTFEEERVLQWRNRALDFDSLEHLKASLQVTPDHHRLARSRMVDDQIALENVTQDAEIRSLAGSPAALALLWDACQIPDYQKISSQSHADLVASLYRHLMSDQGVLPADWFAEQVATCEPTDGDIDTLANRIAHIRTWTFVSHRTDWLAEPAHWQGRTREIENGLSDALHERLTQRFVDQRTSVLMRRLRDKEELRAEIADDGAVYVERHFIGRLRGFRFWLDTEGKGINGKTARNAAAKVLAVELNRRAEELGQADDKTISLSPSGAISWQGEVVGQLEAGDGPLRPGIGLAADENMSAGDCEAVVGRLASWLDGHIASHLGHLVELANAADVTGLARGVAFQLIEGFGVLRRQSVSEDISALDQDARGQLRKYGVRFGAFNIYFPQLLKPAATDLRLLLWTLRHGDALPTGHEQLPEAPRQGLTSAPTDPGLGDDFYRVAGFHSCGNRVVRIDMLERLADMIRPLVSWRQGKEGSAPPPGATGKGGFRVVPDMMSIVGCSGEEFAGVLRALGFQSMPAKTAPAQMTEKTKADISPDSKESSRQTEAGGDQAPEPDIIWRPRRARKAAPVRTETGTGAKPASRAKPSGRAKPAGRAKGARGKKPHAGRGPTPANAKPQAKPAPERKIADPDSPFAVLGKLKETMKHEAGEKV